jgi:hypothetical protein
MIAVPQRPLWGSDHKLAVVTVPEDACAWAWRRCLNDDVTMTQCLQSVLEILNRIVGEFPEAVLREYLQFMFVPLVMRLVNDDVATCRHVVFA